MDSRNQSLDLLRAIAILMVFTGHTVLSYGSPSVLSPLQFGGTGVDLFFVLSGWLIGEQLFKELSQYGNIEIRRFWIRRWMRTLPAYYAVLGYTIVQNLLMQPDFSIPWNYFFFTQNYNEKLSVFTVSWSLCVEEQFYLVIAPLIVFLAKVSRHKRTLILIILLLLPSLFRELDWYSSLKETHVRWDCCVMGILLANIKFSYPELWQKLLDLSPKVASCALLIYLSFFYFRWVPNELIDDPSKLGLAFIFATWVIWANNRAIIFSQIPYRIIYYVSTRSYAIYLLHPDALAVAQRLLPTQPFILYYVFAIIVSCVAAEILYRVVEYPIMNMRSKFSFSQSRYRSQAKLNIE